MTRAAIYARLSQQGETEESIARQVELGIAYAKEHDLDYALYVEPPGARSGYYESKRPQWKALKRDVEAGLVHIVIVGELARAHRNTQQQLEFVNWLNAHKGQFVSLRENIDPTTAAGKMMLTMLAAANEWYRNDISERKTRQYRARDKSIYASNVSPFGLHRSGHYPHIVWNTTPDFPAVILIAELYTSGFGAPSIAKELNARGYKWLNRRLERVPVTHSAITKAIRVFERYAPFLDASLYDAFIRHREQQSILNRRVRVQVHDPFLLTGLLTCALCGSKYHSVTQTKERGYGIYLYKRYQHRNMACQLGNTFRTREPIDNQVLGSLSFLDAMTDEERADIARRAADPAPSQALDVKLKRDKLLERLRGYEEMRADKEITRERYLQVKEQIEQELAALPEESKAETPPLTYAQALAILNALADLLPTFHALVPKEANLFLRAHIKHVWYDGNQVTRIEWADELAILEKEH